MTHVTHFPIEDLTAQGGDHMAKCVMSVMCVTRKVSRASPGGQQMGLMSMPSKPPTYRPRGWRSKQQRDRERPTAAAREYDHKWATAAKAFLAEPGNRLCACGCVE